MTKALNFSIKKMSLYINNKYKLIKWGFITLLYSGFIVLSYFSMPIADASLYFQETVHMAEILKGGSWIGLEPVGTHGFLFKIIPALVFNLIGIKPIILPLFHIVLSFFSILIFEKILKIFIKEKIYLISGIFIFSTTYIFISGTVTYLREIPVLFSSLVLYYCLISKKKSWIIGLTLLLVFDAKEHVFFQLAPGLFLFSIYDQIVCKKDLKRFFLDNLFYWLPIVLYIWAMLYTSFIPINSFVLAILPLSQKGTRWLASGFARGYNTSNIKDLYDINTGRVLMDKLYSIRLVLSKTYLAKPFLPRVFSFLSVHFIFVVPSIYYSISTLFMTIKIRNTIAVDKKMPLFFLFISFLVVYFLRESHGRYLFSITPLIILFFLLYILEYRGRSRKMIIFLFAYMIIALFFELNFVMLKFIITSVLLFILYRVIFVLKSNIVVLSVFAMIFTAGTTITALASLDDGFINRYINQGHYEEVDKVFDGIRLEEGSIYTNFPNVRNARSFVHGKIPNYFSASRFELIDLFEYKKNAINTYYDSPNVFTSNIFDVDQFLLDLNSNRIEYLFFFKSTISNYSFPNEELLHDLVKKNTDIFYLEKSEHLKNKIIYKYKVISDNL